MEFRKFSAFPVFLRARFSRSCLTNLFILYIVCVSCSDPQRSALRFAVSKSLILTRGVMSLSLKLTQ